MKKITVMGADMLHIADLMDNLQDQIDAVGTLMSNSSSEEILRISSLISPLGEKLTTIKASFLGYMEKAETKE